MKHRKRARSGLARRMILVAIIAGVWLMSCGLFSSCEKGSNGRYIVAGKEGAMSVESSAPEGGFAGAPADIAPADPQLSAQDQHISFTGSPVTPAYTAAEGAEVSVACDSDLTSPGEHTVRLSVAQGGGFRAAERTVTVTIDPLVTFNMYQKTVTAHVPYGGTATPPSPVSIPAGSYFAGWEPASMDNITKNCSFDVKYYSKVTSSPGSPCRHEHDEYCDYVETVEAHACIHQHDEACGYVAYQPETPCTHSHDGICGYYQPVCNCDMPDGLHSNDCATVNDPPLPCTHQHDMACGYAAEVAGQPCRHEHGDDCLFEPGIAGRPCRHVHNAACGYVPATP